MLKMADPMNFSKLNSKDIAKIVYVSVRGA